MPYKALDGVIDSLSRHLSSMPRSQVEPLIPADVGTLSRLFPVMLQVGAAASGHLREPAHADPAVLRQRAFAALRELLTRMSRRQPLVVYIDDLHWGDGDSAVLLEELLRPPEAPPIFTIACLRTEEVASERDGLPALGARHRGIGQRQPRCAISSRRWCSCGSRCAR